ncbi:MAG: GAF domain-containing protein, partial [Dehalococcoidia bacterium]|nr:GAF domain-containing protein [Dehalococcoidia bacterium]
MNFVWPTPGVDEESSPTALGLNPGLKVGLSSIISVPLQALERSIGVLHLSHFGGQRFSAKDVELAQAVGDQIAGALANADLFAQTEREARERTVLAEISRIIGSSFDLKRIHAEVAEQVRELLPYDRMSLVKVDQERDTLVSLHAVGHQVPTWAEGKDQILSGSVAEYVTETRAGVLVAVESPQEFVDRFPAQAPLIELMELRSLIAAPLIQDGVVFGVLHLSSETPDAYSTSDLRLAERIAAQIAGGVINADLFARSEEYAREREQLAEIGRIVGSTLELDDLWPRIIEPIKNLITYDRFAVALLDPDTGERWVEFGDGVE